LQAAPLHGDGTRSIRIINPLTGAPAMPLMDCRLMRLTKGQPTAAIRSNANAACFVVSGHGRSRVGEEVFDWAAHDVLTMPGQNVVSHECLSDEATLFFASDREVLRRLGLLVEEKA
jgi:gentisate 1,2-dioxygenase